MLQNITERKKAENALKESEERYRSVVTAMHDGVVLQIASGEIVACNTAAENMLGLSFDQMTGRKSIDPKWHTITEDGENFPGEEHPAMLSLKTGKAITNTIMGVYKPNGTITWININAEPLFEEGNKKPYPVITSFNDITELKKQEKSLKELNATKDKLFSVMAHDLRNPVSAIIGFAEILQEYNRQNNTEKVDAIGEKISLVAKQTIELLSNLLTWSGTQSGRIQFSPVNVKSTAIIGEVISQLEHSAYQKSLKIYNNVASETMVYADVNMLSTIFRNLISNAVKFTPNGGNVSIDAAPQDNDRIKFTITDTGIGISLENIEKIFSVDTQYSTSGTNNEKGTGLGLIICKDFVEYHKGKLNIESQLNKGTSISFTIPAARSYK